MKLYLWICCLIFRSCLISTQDPCDFSLLMDNLDEGWRHPNSTTSKDKPHLCDHQIDETQWYRFTSPVTDHIPTSCVAPNHCSTQWPIWMNGRHPTAASPGPVNVTICAADYGGHCCGVIKKTIQVKFCPPRTSGASGFYVYKLKRVPNCDIAYCAVGSTTPSRENFPQMAGVPIFTGPVRESRRSVFCPSGFYTDFHFTCRVQYPQQATDDGARFRVSLTFDGRTVNKSDTHVVTNATATTVIFPSLALRGNVGKTVSCQVYSYWDGHTSASEVRRSNSSYWAGVRYSSPDYNAATGRVEIVAGSTASIIVTTTVPLALPGCNDLSFMYNHAMVGVEKNDDASDCQVFFKEGRLNHTLRLRTEPTPGCKSYNYGIDFKPYVKPGDSMWRDYAPPSIKGHVRCSEVPLRSCESTYDPIIDTFDRRWFSVGANSGDFLLVRSEVANRKFEVHTRHAGCVNKTITCNCAVAVREGNDILGIQACNGPLTPIRYLRDPKTPDGKADVKKRLDGSYKISMPSGSYVIAHPYTSDYYTRDGTYLNINVYLLRVDAYHTTGLCGNYNLNSSDDGPASGNMHYCTATCETHRLKPQDSYINGHRFIPHCVNKRESATVCRCEDGRSYFNCTADDREEQARVFRTTGTDSCSSNGFGGRNKRTVAEEEVAGDDVILPDDYKDSSTFPPQTDERPAPPTWPTTSGITEQQARDACHTVMERHAAYSICRQHVNLEPVITNCALNIQLMDSIAGSLDGVVEHMTEVCIFDIKSKLNTTSSDPQQQQGVVDEIVQQIEDVSCPGKPTVCSGHGTCKKGRCICDADYVGDDCSLASDAVPVISNFRRGCTCDVRHFTCGRVFVTARDIYNSGRLSCRMHSADSPTAVHTYDGKFVSESELECPLPPAPLSSTSTSPVYTWRISVSNDGHGYSNQLKLTVYDSNCLDCDCSGQCRLKNGKYIKEEKCRYQLGDDGNTNCHCDADEHGGGVYIEHTMLALIVSVILIIILIVIIVCLWRQRCCTSCTVTCGD